MPSKLEKFMQVMDENDEMFFSSGDPDQDIQLVESRLSYQGYWAGERYRYFFDDDMNLTKVEERRFGNG